MTSARSMESRAATVSPRLQVCLSEHEQRFRLSPIGLSWAGRRQRFRTLHQRRCKRSTGDRAVLVAAERALRFDQESRGLFGSSSAPCASPCASSATAETEHQAPGSRAPNRLLRSRKLLPSASLGIAASARLHARRSRFRDFGSERIACGRPRLRLYAVRQASSGHRP